MTTVISYADVALVLEITGEFSSLLRNTEAVIGAIMKVGLEVTTERTKCLYVAVSSPECWHSQQMWHGSDIWGGR
jgi:hypothetical protein